MNPEQIAATFRQARLDAQALSAYPGDVAPADFPSAYAIQELAIAAWPDQVAGWKVAMVPPNYREAYGAERLAGPVFARQVWDGTSGVLDMPLIENGYAAVEAEFAVHIVKEIPLDAQFDDPQQLLPYVEGVYAAVEMAGGPLATLSDFGPGATASDFGNNAGLVIGAKLPLSLLSNPAAVTSAFEINEQVAGQGSAANVPGGPLAAVLFLVRQLASRGRTLRAGDWVSTGASTGIHKVAIGDQAIATFNGQVTIALRMQKAGANGLRNPAAA